MSVGIILSRFDAMKMVLSRRTRERVRKAANRRIEAYIDEVNAATFPHVHLFDEHNLLSQASEWVLGRRLYDSHVQHPTVLSRMVAERYRDLLEMLATLATKKLVVCDLDNTLWEGEIGEGAVRHHRDRQAILKRLRSQGVLLAINSRNDPKNVHWRDAVLDESDFVAAEINWDAKPNNMKRIQQKLNLKTKDFVFIDDRADQRALVSEVFPDIHVMDAISERSWKLLDLWSQLIRPGDEADRTQFYREREEREKFLGEEAAEHDPAALMAGLGLRANVRFAGRSDLERVVELINRTNQFNLNGTRTSFREVARLDRDTRSAHPGHRRRRQVRADGAYLRRIRRSDVDKRTNPDVRAQLPRVRIRLRDGDAECDRTIGLGDRRREPARGGAPHGSLPGDSPQRALPNPVPRSRVPVAR